MRPSTPVRRNTTKKQVSLSNMTEATELQEIEDREHGTRHVSGRWRTFVAVLAFCWSAFQLSTLHLSVNSLQVRAVHLSFALALAFFSFKPLRSKRLTRMLGGRWAGLTASDRLPWLDVVLAGLAASAALYLVVFEEALANRSGNAVPVDLIAGVILLVLLLDAARRCLGPALPTVASVFIVYALFAERAPLDVLRTKSSTLKTVIEQLCLSTEGIYGTPLQVSANTVFLFVLFGTLLEKAGGGKYFIDLAYSLLGGYRGGPAKASVLASGMTGMINGSSIANTVTTGTFTIPLMKKSGYPAEKAGAIEVAASTNGQLMPPIMGAAAFIIAENCNLPYIEVVRAAFIPAFISYIALIYITHLEACKLNLQPVPKSELPRFLPTFVGGLYFLLPILVLIFILVFRQGTSPSFAAYYAILALLAVVLLERLVREKTAGFHSFWVIFKTGMVDGARNMMSIGVAVAAAGIIVGTLQLGLSGQVTTLIGVLSGGTLVGMLLITAVVSLILGMGLPTTANYIVMASLTAVAITELSADMNVFFPILAVHLFVFYFGILSDDTPPVGLSAYAAAAISRGDPIKTGIQGFMYDIRTAILPFMFLFNTRLLLMDVDSFWEVMWVFLTSLAAMFAFAAATQGYFRRKNRWWETLALLGLSFLLFRPDLPASLLKLAPDLVLVILLILLAAVYMRQGSGNAQESQRA